MTRITLKAIKQIISPNEKIEVYTNRIFTHNNFLFEGEANVFFKKYGTYFQNRLEVFQIVPYREHIIIILKGDLRK